ncbi:hypothetical protein QJS66_01065 [Kocuria rhizophila]|nr:hypothetical protein QJS66_01065 [Kocuria rhizophila]
MRKIGIREEDARPDAGAAGMREQLENFDEREIDRVEAMVRSMTRTSAWPPSHQRLRHARIARGSGVTVSEVDQLMERFAQAQKMMKRLASGRASHGTAGGIPRMGRGGAAKGKAKRRVRAPATPQAGPGAGGHSHPGRAGREGQRVRRPGKDLDAESLNLPRASEKFLGK